jgi:hypothetical protein
VAFIARQAVATAARLIQLLPGLISLAPDWPGMSRPAKLNSQNGSKDMRAFFLAATILCFTGLAASAQPSKMNPNPDATGVEGPAGTSAEPSKMTPNPSGVEGLTGAMRDVGSPWLDHAINDVGTNPTGWKRQWCAKSVSLWLAKRQEGLRRQHRHLLPQRRAQIGWADNRRAGGDEASRRHREGSA